MSPFVLFFSIYFFFRGEKEKGKKNKIKVQKVTVCDASKILGKKKEKAFNYENIICVKLMIIQSRKLNGCGKGGGGLFSILNLLFLALKLRYYY